MKNISNTDDFIDSRDVIERIDELRAGWMATGDTDDLTPEEAGELAILEALADEGGVSPDWDYGETLIRDSYFREYAQNLASDIGAITDEYSWPASHIDWRAAAAALQQDYFDVDFDGVRYWIRG